MPHHHHHHQHHQKHLPHEEFVGAIIAVSVWGILYDYLFPYAWWSHLVVIILSFNVLVQLIRWLSGDERKNFTYTTSWEDVWPLWLALIIVSVVMNSLFYGWDEWIALIPITVLAIKSVEVFIMFIVARFQLSDQRRKNQIKSVNVAQYGRYQSNYNVRPVIQVAQASSEMQHTIQVTDSSNFSSNEDESSKFCPVCGGPHESRDRFCQFCGEKLRNN